MLGLLACLNADTASGGGNLGITITVQVSNSADIVAIEPSAGPPGTQGIITGTSFGATPGSVVFTPDGGAGTGWQVLSWADAEVAFRVPLGTAAGAGQVTIVRSDAVESNSAAFQVTSPTVLCVDDDNATGIENGTARWPFDTIQEAVSPAPDAAVVRVARGTYADTGGSVVYVLNQTLYLRGGYVGGTDYATSPGDFDDATRDWDAHVTVIDGQDTRRCISLDSADGELSGFTLTRGSAGLGGGMYNIASSPAIAHVTFSDNHAFEAGGMYNAGSDPTLTHVTFTDNQADVHGGGMWNVESDPALTHVSFSGNHAGYGGGMASYYNGRPTLTDVTFDSNQARYGGGMYNDSSSPTLTRVTFIGNRGETAVGGMFNRLNSAVLTHVTFTRNQGGELGGGGMYNSTSDATLTHVTFTGNQAGTQGGGGMRNSGSNLTLTHVTFSGNRTSGDGGAIWNSSSNAALVSCILWDNQAQTSPEIHNDGSSTTTVTYSDVQGGYPGTDNLDVDPLFAAPGHWDDNGTPGDVTDDIWVAGDYHLKSQAGRYNPATGLWVVDAVHSPCIDAGDPASPIGDEPAPNAGRANMGAYGATGQASKSIPLAPPGVLPLGPIAQSSIQANWTAGGNPAGTLSLSECWRGNGFEGIGTKVAESGYAPDLTFHNFTTLDTNTQYRFRARARAAPPGTEETDWTDLGTAYTRANAPGALSVDMQVMSGPALRVNAPGSKSLGVLGIALNGNPAWTQIAIKVGNDPGAGWLRFVASGARTDLYATGAAPEWHTAAEWANKRLRGLTPNTAYEFSTRARNGDGVETVLSAVGSYTTNSDCDVDNSGGPWAVRGSDFALLRHAVRTGTTLGVDQPWPCDVNDDGLVDWDDLWVLLDRLMHPQ